MPLLKGKKHIGDNIKELETNGSRPRSHKQILAIALNAAGESKKPGNRLKAFGKKKKAKVAYSDNDADD